MFGFFSDLKKRLVALEQKIEVVWHHLFSITIGDEPKNAEQDKEASADDGSSSAQPAVREEDGDPAVSGDGVQSGGHSEVGEANEATKAE